MHNFLTLQSFQMQTCSVVLYVLVHLYQSKQRQASRAMINLHSLKTNANLFHCTVDVQSRFIISGLHFELIYSYKYDNTRV